MITSQLQIQIFQNLYTIHILPHHIFSPFVSAPEKHQEKKFVLQLEVDETKIPEILRLIGNQNLTNLVK